MRYIPLELKYMPEPNSGCWLWTAALGKAGYGSLRDPRVGHTVHAHRYMWELENGPIPSGLEICHKCDVRSCVNPQHMFLGTRSDNMQDCSRKKRVFVPGFQGEDVGTSKLMEFEINEIRKRRAMGELLQDVANDFGIHYSTVSKIALRKAWGHI